MLTRADLLTLGFSAKGIKHRVATGRFHVISAGIYAVGRPELTPRAEHRQAARDPCHGSGPDADRPRHGTKTLRLERAVNEADKLDLVDFSFPDDGLVVETDGLRYHRTPAQQARAVKRDQTHQAAGLRVLRFTHWQIAYEPDEVTTVLRQIRPHLSATAATSSRPAVPG